MLPSHIGFVAIHTWEILETICTVSMPLLTRFHALSTIVAVLSLIMYCAAGTKLCFHIFP